MEAPFEASARFVALRDYGILTGSEGDRLASLRRLGLLDTAPTAAFDATVRLTAAALGAPFAVIALVDEHRVWCKAQHGIDGVELPRRAAFCSEVVLAREPLIVRDATLDARFEENPWVCGSNRVRSYVGVPLFARDGQAVGAFGVMDRDVRRFGELELATLTEYAKIVEEFFAAREHAGKAGMLQYAMEREKLFRETFEQAAVGIVHTALSGAILRINQRACALLGHAAADLRGLTFQDLTHAEDLPNNVRAFKRMLAGEIDSYRLEQRLKRSDQSHLWCLLSVALKRSARQPDYNIVVIEDITSFKQAQSAIESARDALTDKVELQARRLKESNEALKAQTQKALEAGAALEKAQAALHAAKAKLIAENLTDELTGLPNRLSFSRRSEQAAQALRSARKPYGLVLLDLDDFKQINDVFGHDVGDEVLCAFGKILLGQLRNSDLAARVGGEEFAVLCFGEVTEQTLHDVAERIRTQIKRETLATAKGLLRLSASFGLALSHPDDLEWKTVYARADAALEAAKTGGKDRISFGRSMAKGNTARLKALSIMPPASG